MMLRTHICQSRLNSRAGAPQHATNNNILMQINIASFSLSPLDSGCVWVLLVSIQNLYQHRHCWTQFAQEQMIHSTRSVTILLPQTKTKPADSLGRAQTTRTLHFQHLPAPTVVSTRAAVLKTCPRTCPSVAGLSPLRSAQPRADPSSAAHRVWPHARGRGGA